MRASPRSSTSTRSAFRACARPPGPGPSCRPARARGSPSSWPTTARDTGSASTDAGSSCGPRGRCAFPRSARDRWSRASPTSAASPASSCRSGPRTPSATSGSRTNAPSPCARPIQGSASSPSGHPAWRRTAARYCVPRTLSMQRRTASERVASRLPSTGVTLPPSSRKSGALVVALPGGEQAAVAVRPGVGGAAAERFPELVHDPVGELLRGGDQLEAVPVTVDGDEAPLGLREAGARGDVLDAPADGGLVGRHVSAAERHPAEALAAVGLPAGGAGGPRRAREERVRDPVIAPPRPPREDGAAALAYRGLGTRLGLDGDRRLLLAPHAAAVQAAN